MPEQTRPRHRWAEHLPAAGLAVLAALVALWARHTVFPAYSWNRDEPVYLWHVEVLRAGLLTATDGGHPGLFLPWLSASAQGELFTQYTLGWPLVLLAAEWLTGAPGAALLLGAALAVIGTYALGLELLQDRRVATVAAGLMVASPILPIQGGAYLSYLFTLGLGLIFGVLLLSGIRTGRWPRLAVAGVVLGWIFMTRPYDAVLWGLAFGVYALVRSRSRVRPLALPALLVSAGAIPLFIATLAYNRHLTGNWLQFPITAADPMDTFGFGAKRLMPTFPVVHYGVGTALRATAKNAFVLPWFLVGGYLGLIVTATGLWGRRREPSTLALVLVAAVFPLGYFVFWGNHLSSMASRISGPIYLIPLFAPITLLMASVLVRLWVDRRGRALALAAALALATIPGAVTRLSVNREISETQEPWRSSVAHLEDRALVFVADTAPYLLYLNPFSSNGPRLDDRVLYAADNGAEMLDLIAEQPDRTPYVQQADIGAQDVGPRERPVRPEVRVVRATVVRGAALTLTVTVGPRAARDGRVRITTGRESVERRIDLASGASVTLTTALRSAGSGPGLLVGERGAISVATGAAGRERRVDLVYRVVDDTIEVLLPSASFHQVTVDGKPEWRRVPALDGLRATVSPG
ncbi:MAG: hypothetical protein ACT4OV_01390 [Microthrixaceae bacterium]